MLATPEVIAASAQRDRLSETLPRAFTQVPLYRDSGAGANRMLRLPSQPDWVDCPFITKQDIRRGFPHNFLDSDQDLEELLENDLIELEHTSGTSEERTPLLLPRGWWAEQERRALELNAHIAEALNRPGSTRRVTISSPVCSGDICYTGVPTRSERILGDALHLSLSRFPFLWSQAELDRMVTEALEWDPLFLDLDPVYGVVFALHCERRGVSLPSLRFVLCSYEFLSTVHRRILERVFNVPVFNLYGSTETGHLLMEDTQGSMAPSLATAYLEVVERDERGVGELVVTTLTNEFMPLVRYKIGDLVQEHRCSYSSRYTVFGRVADAFLTPDGKRVTTWDIDRCFHDSPGIAHYQLIERNAAPWLFRFVPDSGFPQPELPGKIQRHLAELLCLRQPLQVQEMEILAPESSGKFRLGYPTRKGL